MNNWTSGEYFLSLLKIPSQLRLRKVIISTHRYLDPGAEHSDRIPFSTWDSGVCLLLPPKGTSTSKLLTSLLTFPSAATPARALVRPGGEQPPWGDRIRGQDEASSG